MSPSLAEIVGLAGLHRGGPGLLEALADRLDMGDLVVADDGEVLERVALELAARHDHRVERGLQVLQCQGVVEHLDIVLEERGLGLCPSQERAELDSP